jgi:hypothetical protein
MRLSREAMVVGGIVGHAGGTVSVFPPIQVVYRGK